ncbi:MAG: hypothetical protein ABIM60_03875, partial [candidate division WOR-3 bacterium]
IIKDFLKDFEINEDNFGNLIISNSSSPKFLFLTRIDENTFFIKEEEKGLFKFSLLGDYKPINIVDHFVIFKDGKKGVIRNLKEKGEPEISDLRVEILGEKKPEIGESFIIEPFFYKENNFYISSNLDSRICLSFLIHFLKNHKHFPLKVIFLVKTKLSEKGVIPAIINEKSEFTFVLDTVSCKDEIDIGKGPVISFIEKNYVLPIYLKEKLLNILEKEDIIFQKRISEEYSNFNFYLFQSGYKDFLLIYLPVKYKNSVCKVAKGKDLEILERLFEILLKKL